MTDKKSPWQPMDNAPKDYPILLDVGLPWPVVGVWNLIDEQWVYANIQWDYGDAYFENEVEKEPFFWRPMPDLLEVEE